MKKYIQDIYKYSINNIIKIIDKILNGYKIEDNKIFYPKSKLFFNSNIKYLKSLNNKKLYNSLKDYKSNSFITNKLLIHKKFPLLFFIDISKLSKNIFNQSYIKFKNDYIKNYINNINNIDKIIDNNYLKDIILFRGTTSNNNIINNINDSKMKSFFKLTDFPNEKKILFKKNKIIKFDSFLSCSLSPYIAINFTNDLFYVIRIKEKHKIPAIFLSSIFFKQNIDFNKYENYNYEEFEILLARNCKFMIKDIKYIYVKKTIKKISNLYKGKKYIKKIKVVYLESVDYIVPEEFNIDKIYYPKYLYI